MNLLKAGPGHVPHRFVAELPGLRAGVNGAGEHLHGAGPAADQGRCDVAVVEHGAAAAAGACEPGGAAVVAVAGAVVDFRAGPAAEAAGGVERAAGQAGRLPAVLVNPVGDRVVGDGWPVAQVAESAPDLGGELALIFGYDGGEAPPVQRPDQGGDEEAKGGDRVTAARVRRGAGRCSGGQPRCASWRWASQSGSGRRSSITAWVSSVSGRPVTAASRSIVMNREGLVATRGRLTCCQSSSNGMPCNAGRAGRRRRRRFRGARASPRSAGREWITRRCPCGTGPGCGAGVPRWRVGGAVDRKDRQSRRDCVLSSVPSDLGLRKIGSDTQSSSG